METIKKQLGKGINDELNAYVLISSELPRIQLKQLFRDKKIKQFIIERAIIKHKNVLNKKTGFYLDTPEFLIKRRIVEFTDGFQYLISSTVYSYYKNDADTIFKLVKP